MTADDTPRIGCVVDVDGNRITLMPEETQALLDAVQAALEDGTARPVTVALRPVNVVELKPYITEMRKTSAEFASVTHVAPVTALDDHRPEVERCECGSTEGPFVLDREFCLLCPACAEDSRLCGKRTFGGTCGEPANHDGPCIRDEDLP